MDTSVITDALVDNDFAYIPAEDLYSKSLNGGEYLEVAVDERDSSVTAIRYNAQNKQLNYEHVTLRTGVDVQRVLRIIG